VNIKWTLKWIWHVLKWVYECMNACHFSILLMSVIAWMNAWDSNFHLCLNENECMRLHENGWMHETWWECRRVYFFFNFSFFLCHSESIVLSAIVEFIYIKILFLKMRNVSNPEVNVKIGYYWFFLKTMHALGSP